MQVHGTSPGRAGAVHADRPGKWTGQKEKWNAFEITDSSRLSTCGLVMTL